MVGVRTESQSSIAIDESINISDPGRDQTVTTTVSGLAAGTKTYFNVYAVNEFGNASFAEEVNCTTQALTMNSDSSSTIVTVVSVLSVLLFLIAVGIVIVVKRRTDQMSCRECQFFKEKEHANENQAGRSIADRSSNTDEERSQYLELDANQIASPSVYSELGGTNHIYQNDQVTDGDRGQYESLHGQSPPNVYEDLRNSTTDRTYVNTMIAGNRKK
ncbi:uncharacterized protein [Argopecten irradians]|uniref:uncharacterized protein n=1 Tax=Argopecten irradians TaxID=31199 RepID=UPI00370FBE61